MKDKNIKILPALFLSLCLSASFPAFAENSENSQPEADIETDTDTQTDANTQTDADTQTDVDTQIDTASSSAYARGTVSESGFQSEWLNMQFTPPDYMVMSSEEELQSIVQYGQNAVQQSASADESTPIPETIYEMMAASSAGFPNVSVVVEASPQENSTPDQYFAALKQSLDTTQLGYQYEETISDASVAGQDFRVLTASLTMNGYQVFQKYYTRKQEDRFVSIILSYTEDTAAQGDEVLASFTALQTQESPEESTATSGNEVTQ